MVPLTLLASVLAAMAATRSAGQRLAWPLSLLLLVLLLGAWGCGWPRRSGWEALLLTQRLLLVMLRGQCATVALHRAATDMGVATGCSLGLLALFHCGSIAGSTQLSAQHGI